jgi:glycosyltransferase involved in cell wall biosynthesis
MRLTDLVTPLKPLEAMAGRKFVMASDVGGHRELVDHGINGRLFEPDSSASIADAVIAWAGNDPEMENMLDAAERLVTQTRNWEASVALYEGVYARIYGKADIGDS